MAAIAEMEKPVIVTKSDKPVTEQMAEKESTEQKCKSFSSDKEKPKTFFERLKRKQTKVIVSQFVILYLFIYARIVVVVVAINRE